jgi:hypothetical protein
MFINLPYLFEMCLNKLWGYGDLKEASECSFKFLKNKKRQIRKKTLDFVY